MTARLRKTLQLIVALVLVIVTIFLLCCNDLKKVVITSAWVITGFSVSSEDGHILVEWDSINSSNIESFQIQITNDNGEPVLAEECSPYSERYRFIDGVHGNAYKIGLNIILSDGQAVKTPVQRAMFLDYSSIKDAPLIKIDTLDGSNPTYDIVSSPTGWGQGTVNNEYETAGLSFIDNGNLNYYSDIKVRIRGNTSAVDKRKGYKLKVKTAVNMMNPQNDEYAHKEWLLIPAYDLKFAVATEIAKICGMEWQPRCSFVNVLMNGDYLGCYWLTEEINASVNRCNIDESGYIIECDAYWWNSDDEYFKIDDQIPQMGYTFTYPDYNQLNDSQLTAIKQHFNQAITYLRNGDKRYLDYIDINTWSAWLLIHDILGTFDSAGSNIYYYKENFKINNANSSKIKMGPVWDFDSAFLSEAGWSKIRNEEFGFFPLLLNETEFIEKYEEKWTEVSDGLMLKVDNKIKEFFIDDKTITKSSFHLNSIRWQTEQITLEEQRTFYRNKLDGQIKWINNNIN